MNIKALATALERAAEFLRASGAKAQADSVAAVAVTVAAATQESVEVFVNETKVKLNAPKLHDLTAEEFIERLNSSRNDAAATLELLSSLKSPGFDRTKVIEIANLLLAGRRNREFKTKPMAVKAIEERIHERLYLDSKDAMNAKVAPW